VRKNQTAKYSSVVCIFYVCDIDFCVWTATEEAGGKALQVVVAEDDHSFILDENALKTLLLDPRVRDRKIIILSVAGAYRKGKSFLLDFFLRYLYAKVG